MARATPAALFHPLPPPQQQHQQQQQQTQGRRTKRGLDATDRDFATANTKKTRIAVEIFSRPASQKVHPLVPPPQQTAPQTPATTRPAAVAASSANSTKPGLPPSEADPNVTKHQAKVINGIKHELDRLQPDMAFTKEPSRDPGREPGRKLRSQEATRFKSDLSAYFPDYDEVIGNEPKEQCKYHLIRRDFKSFFCHWD